MITKMEDSRSGNTSPIRSHARTSRRFSTEKDLRRVEEEDVVQGRVFWLPPKEDLPSRVVRRAHGKGAIEEGLYNHPVVVISRPADESHIIHFHIITSFQGKRLHELYSKSNEFHTSRRSWYLPIFPSPDHPDASSKKSKKRFPTLELAGGAYFRWDSYVNLRHVYKIDWSHLRPYTNPDTPERQVFRFDSRESMVRLVAKTKVLTNYEPGPQYLQRTQPPPKPRPCLPGVSVNSIQSRDEIGRDPLNPAPLSPKSDTDTSSIISSEYPALSPILQLDFDTTVTDDERSSLMPPKAPPDRKRSMLVFIRRLLWYLLKWPLALIGSALATI